MQPNDEHINVTTSARGWTISGELDVFGAEGLDHTLEHLPNVGDGPIEIDLAGVTFIDSSGLRVLLRLADRVAAEGGAVQIRNPSDAVTRLVAITKLGSTFGLDPIESDPPADPPADQPE